MTLYDGAGLQQTADDVFEGRTDPTYWNAVGPFGGWIAAVVLRCLDVRSGGKSDPLTLSINFAGPMEPGPFALRLRIVRANRSTAFWAAELTQEQAGATALCASATVVLAQRRESPAFLEMARPELPKPEDLPAFTAPVPLPFLKRLDMRFVRDGAFPKLENGEMHTWVRALDSETLDYETLTAICDSGLPQIFLRLRRPVPVSSVTMNVFYHAKREDLARVGADFVLTVSRMRSAANGFFDTTTSVWAPSGALLATTEQVVWFRVPD